MPVLVQHHLLICLQMLLSVTAGEGLDGAINFGYLDTLVALS
jgi:hypothetical protein